FVAREKLPPRSLGTGVALPLRGKTQSTGSQKSYWQRAISRGAAPRRGVAPLFRHRVPDRGHRRVRRSGSMSANAAVIYRTVRKELMEALNVDGGDVKAEATLQGGLGAALSDFLDIVFRLEREFGIKIPRGERFPESVFEGNPEFVCEGRVTDRGMGELRARMPYADLGGFAHDRRVSSVSELFTVDLLTRYIA